MLYFIYPSQLFQYVYTVWERAKNKENIYGWDLCTYYTGLNINFQCVSVLFNTKCKNGNKNLLMKDRHGGPRSYY